ncbi:hypothetical protein GUITHDRAFT_115436 [Guillardia theta CCMP2712]|uniref:Uncharacterized protein n=1 Tax=Guillardia theta (strain CCMP2712) TaxID=905079 RepID=L1IQA7_GUITC|nr:hypothetical protein GUITHDRAFT_115436 [Guillardia theta CCMP2712]EKX38471.1 hypothetical protein GUITHDRAFT_115436 [Guillardia theta CCMP2712]|eukprot:XP_005825451.1 hypothetical protein GUITHDRAFT_115436 [Guillardia theta CCMP2712]
MARERKAPELFKPTNFKATAKKAPARKAPIQPTNVVRPVRPITVQRASPADVPVLAAIPIDEPVRPSRKPVAKEPPTVAAASSYSKKYRHPKDYKDLKMVNDQITRDMNLAVHNVVFKRYKDDELDFTIYDKALKLQTSLSPFNGPNSWTSKVCGLDYKPSQYDSLPYLNRPTLAEIKDNVYVGEKLSDSKTASNLNTIIKTTTAQVDPNDLTTVLKHHRQIILEMLLYAQENKRSPSTYWDYIRALTRLARICLGDDNELYKKLAKLGDDFDKAVIKNIETKNVEVPSNLLSTDGDTVTVAVTLEVDSDSTDCKFL